MSWEDEILPGVYVTPVSEVRIEFQYENVRKSFDRRTTAYDFPDADGTFIQDLGRTGRHLPIRAIFSGPEYLVAAAAFEEGLSEKGVGRLEHPLYGFADVVPFGRVSRRDDLVTRANQAIVEVRFWETTGLLFPSSQGSPSAEVESAISKYQQAQAEQLEQDLVFDSTIESVSFKDRYEAALSTVKSGLDAIAETEAEIEKAFNNVNDSINNGIDILISQPLTLAFQTSILLGLPAQALASIKNRLSAYRNLASSIVNREGSVRTPGNDAQEANKFHSDDMFASGLVVGAATAAINAQFATRPEALSAAVDLIAAADEVVAWRDENYKALASVDTGQAYQQFIEVVNLTAGFLVEISFDLKQERMFTLESPRTMIDVVAELYGEVDSQLDFFIASNDLTGSEILELPAGKTVVYYI